MAVLRASIDPKYSLALIDFPRKTVGRQGRKGRTSLKFPSRARQNVEGFLPKLDLGPPLINHSRLFWAAVAVLRFFSGLHYKTASRCNPINASIVFSVQWKCRDLHRRSAGSVSMSSRGHEAHGGRAGSSWDYCGTRPKSQAQSERQKRGRRWVAPCRK